MGNAIAGKIDALMKITNTQNAQLARALNFDASYISRIRAGKRGLPPEQPFILPASKFFARNIREPYQRDALAKELGLAGEWPSDKDRAALLIEAWLENRPGGMEDEAASGAASAAAGVAEEVRLFFGSAGRRAAALAFLGEIADAGEPCTLMLSSDEDTAWMYEDAAFAREWTALMGRLAAMGCAFKVVHTVSRDANEMWEGVREWLPLYATGAVEPYYYPRLRDGVRMRSLFVASGKSVLVGNTVRGMGGDGMLALFHNRDAVTAYESEFAAYLKMCKPLVKAVAADSQALAQLHEELASAPDGALALQDGNICVKVAEGQGAIITFAEPADTALVVEEPRLAAALAEYVRSKM